MGGNESDKNVFLFFSYSLGTKLGEKTASEPIILGNKFMEGFEQLLFGISLLCDSLSAEPFLGPSSATASNLKLMAENMKSQLNQYLSKSVKSI